MTRPILTAAEMRDAEARIIACGTSAAELMGRAGLGVAEAVWRYAGPLPVLVLCGPGNNGGDGYVAARHLRSRGVDVRIAALGEPKAGAAAGARSAWDGPVAPLGDASAAPVLIDALFGTGLSRGLEPDVADRLTALATGAQIRVAVDLPSGVETDTGALLSDVPAFDLTVTFAAVKPAHRLQPAAARCGRVAVVDIGVPVESRLIELETPALAPPDATDHKFSRGMVGIVGRKMPGASELAALAAAHAGAGYVLLLQHETVQAAPHAIVRKPIGALEEILADRRLGAVVIGPGLGRDEEGARALRMALAAQKPLVIDGDALHLLDGASLASPTVLTPHEGEFRALFPDVDDASKVSRARIAAKRMRAVVVYKGADTVIAAPNGRAAISGEASPWLSSAGTGDVLAGAIGAMLARGLDPLAAAGAGVWLHREAARRAGKAFVADDLARHLAAGL